MINTVLFDFDGTIINTNDVIVDAWQHTYMHYLGHKVPEEHILKTFGEPLLITMEREFPGVDPKESAEVYRARQRERQGDLVHLIPGMEDMIRELKAMGYQLIIVTSRTTVSTIGYLERFKIADLFDDLVSCDDTEIHKPNPEPAFLGLKKGNVSKDEAIMIGDSPFDIKCANNAGIKSVMVNWTMTPESPLIDSFQPDYRIDKPEDFITLLKNLREQGL